MGTFYDQELTPLAVNCLSKARLFLGTEKEDEYLWVWVVLAIHQSLYTFCITCLHENSPSFALNKKRTATIGFMEALNRVQRDEYMRFKRKKTTNALRLTKEQKDHLRELHKDWRNYFVHFRDDESGKIIDRAYMTKDISPLLNSALEAIRLLCKSNVVPFYRYDGDLKQQAGSLLIDVFYLLKSEAGVD